MELIFRKTASPVTLAVNCLTGIFHGFWLQSSVHICSTALLLQNFFHWIFRFPFILFPLKAFKTNCLIYIIKVFSEGKITDYLDHLIAEHTKLKKVDTKPLISPIPKRSPHFSFTPPPPIPSKFFSYPNYAKSISPLKGGHTISYCFTSEKPLDKLACNLIYLFFFPV